MVRKYEGVPTQREITKQFEELSEKVKEITTLKQVKNLLANDKDFHEIEINYNPIKDYNNEPIDVIRYDYKNILAYANIYDEEVEVNPYITLYSDDGLQFADVKYDRYEEEISRVAEMGLLREETIHSIQFSSNASVGTDDSINILVLLPKGITKDMAKEIDNLCSDYMNDYWEENNGDYENFDYYEMIETVLEGLNIECRYPKAEYTIYL